MRVECVSCGRRRVDGWVLVEGRCLDCNRIQFVRRVDERREEIKRLVELGEERK